MPALDPQATQWRYATKYPPPHRMSMDELPDHRFGFVQRTEKLLGKVRQYKARCTCRKWEGADFRHTKAQARRDFLHHVAAAERQLTLIPRQ